MEQFSLNSKMRKCAFCRHWYDPTNSCIRPKAPNIGIWEYDNRVKRMCLKRNTEIESFYGCPKYECKLEGGNQNLDERFMVEIAE